MLRVNLSTGETLSYDLEDKDDAARWRAAQSDSGYQSRVRAVQVVLRNDGRDRAVFACPRPDRRFRSVTWDADIIRGDDGEVLRERVQCYADKVCVTLNVYRRRNPPWCTVAVTHPGRRVLLPPR